MMYVPVTAVSGSVLARYQALCIAHHCCIRATAHALSCRQYLSHRSALIIPAQVQPMHLGQLSCTQLPLSTGTQASSDGWCADEAKQHSVCEWASRHTSRQDLRYRCWLLVPHTSCPASPCTSPCAKSQHSGCTMHSATSDQHEPASWQAGTHAFGTYHSDRSGMQASPFLSCKTLTIRGPELGVPA